MRPLDRWLFWTLAPLWALALLLSLLSLDRNEVVSPFRVEGAVSEDAHPRVASVHAYARAIPQPGGGVEPGDELLRIGDVELRGASAPRAIGVVWSEMGQGGSIALTVRRDGRELALGSRIPATIPKWPTLLVSLAFGLVGVVGLLRFPSLRVMQVSFPALMAMAIWTGSYFGHTPAELLAAFGLRCASLLVLQPLNVRLVRHYPDGRDDAAWARGWPALLGLNAFLVVDDTMSGALPHELLFVGPRLFGLIGLLICTAVGIDRYRRAGRVDRRRFKWLLFGMVIGGVPGAAVSTATIFQPELGAWFLPSQAAQLAVPVCLFIAIVRHQLFDIDRLLNLTTVVLAAASCLVVAAWQVGVPAHAWLVDAAGLSPRTAALVLLAAGVAAVTPLAMRGRRALDSWVLRDRRERERAVRLLLERISAADKLREIAALVTEGIASIWNARGVAVWLRTDAGLVPIATHGSLAPEWEGRAGSLGEDGDAPLGHLRFAVPAPRPGAEPAGAILLGPRRSGESFEDRDASLLALIAERTGASIATLTQRELLSHAHTLNRELEQRRRHSERESEEKSHLIATASHDLRQPLQALRLFLGTLEGRLREPEERALVCKAQQAAIAMQQTFETLLDLTRLDAGVLEARIEDVALSDLFVELHAFLDPLARARGLALRFEPTRLVARSDPALLRSILQNLVGNAIRYTDEGSVRIAATRGSGGTLVIEVADTGRGFSASEREALFEPWRRGAGMGRAGDGLGLGLAIVSRLAGLLDHPLELDTVPGRGSRFRLALAAGADEVRVARADRSRIGAAGARKLDGRRVLVVEDDAEARLALASLLTSWGVEVVAAPDLEAALAGCGETPPDAVLVDHALAEGIGFQVIDALQARHGRLACALLTAQAQEAILREAADRGLPLLRKPAAPVQVRALLASLLD